MLIAEIGNNHLGDMDKAKELIRAANNSGATIIKSQAFRAKDIKTGSMPHSFYQACELNFDQYLELIYYARSIGNDLFYSIFSRDLQALEYHQQFYKITGSQVALGFNNIERRDTRTHIVSIPEFSIMPNLKKAIILSVTSYMTNKPNLDHINFLSTYYGRPVGLSDHSIDIKWALKAITHYGVPHVEKHFTITKNLKFGDMTYRDGLHGALPNEFELLAKAMGDKCAV